MREQDRYDEAQRYFEEALAIRREVGDREGEAATLTNLGALARVQGRPEEAARDYAEALAICEAIGAVNLAQTVRGNMEYLAQQQEQPQEQHQEQPQAGVPTEASAYQLRRRRRWWWPFGGHIGRRSTGADS